MNTVLRLLSSYYARVEQAVPYLALFVVLVVGVYFGWEAHQIAFGMIFFWGLIQPVSSRVLGAFTVGLFLLVSVMSRGSYLIRAEQLAVLGYLLLVLTLINALFEAWEAKRKKESNS